MSEISEEQDHQQCDPVLHVDQTGESAGGVFNLTLMNSTFSRLVPCSEELIRWRGCFVPPETTKTHLKKKNKNITTTNGDYEQVHNTKEFV